MSTNRFQFLLRYLRFYDTRDRQQRREVDKLVPIGKVFEIMKANLKKYYIPYEYLTIDEQLLAFSETLFVRAKYEEACEIRGQKFSIVVAKTAYTLNLVPYFSTQPEGPYKCSYSAKDIVCRQVTPIVGINRNITADNWFTSADLAKTLLHDTRLTYVGTICKNRHEIPKEFLLNKSKPPYLFVFEFQEDCTLVSYTPKKNKAGLLI